MTCQNVRCFVAVGCLQNPVYTHCIYYISICLVVYKYVFVETRRGDIIQSDPENDRLQVHEVTRADNLSKVLQLVSNFHHAWNVASLSWWQLVFNSGKPM